MDKKWIGNVTLLGRPNERQHNEDQWFWLKSALRGGPFSDPGNVRKWSAPGSSSFHIDFSAPEAGLRRPECNDY